MAIFDLTLMAEMAGLVTATMQAVKTHPKIRGSSIPRLSAVTGAGAATVWYAVTGDMLDSTSWLGIDWEYVFRGIFTGIGGAVLANGGYNLQKFLPIPNLLPTASELDASALNEQVVKKELVAVAVANGTDPVEAKKAVGLDPVADPPSVAVLEKIQPSELDSITAPTEGNVG